VALPRGGIVITSDRVWRMLAYSWWILYPAFFLLVLRFSYERACLNPYELLRPLMRHQSLALMIAAIYTGAHLWIVSAGVLLARMIPSRQGPGVWAVSVGVKDAGKIVAMSVAIALEQVPRAVWAWLYHAIGVC
jgi:hypothetical protein